MTANQPLPGRVWIQLCPSGGDSGPKCTSTEPSSFVALCHRLQLRADSGIERTFYGALARLPI